jgi:putative component of membrane protein insertase Oxa1/YidC/SpoIIIJ protein YidD
MTRRKRWLVVAVIAPLLLLGIDLTRPPARQLSARALLGGIAVYRASGSRWVGRLGVRCRFEPSCSRYAERVIARDGALVGSLRAGWRILRCGPWTPRGTRDEP